MCKNKIGTLRLFLLRRIYKHTTYVCIYLYYLKIRLIYRRQRIVLFHNIYQFLVTYNTRTWSALKKNRKRIPFNLYILYTNIGTLKIYSLSFFITLFFFFANNNCLHLMKRSFDLAIIVCFDKFIAIL